MTFNIDDLIDEAIKEQEFHLPRFAGSFYASELGGCSRKVYFNFIYPKKQILPETLRIFHLGSSIHSLIQNIIKKKADDFDYLAIEHPCQITDTITDLNISGRIDVYARLKDGERVLWELKSIASLQYLKKPLNHHRMQLMLYMRAKRLQTSKLIYICKKNLQTKTFDVSYSEELFQSLLKKARMIYQHLKDKTPPLKLPVYPTECNFCQFNKECADYEKGKQS